VLYNQKITTSFSEKDFDFKVFDSPEELYNEIVTKNNEK
jgi:hypothetical protein